MNMDKYTYVMHNKEVYAISIEALCYFAIIQIKKDSIICYY